MNQNTKDLLKTIADLSSTPTGAFNIRSNGKAIQRQCSENIEIITKEDKTGIDITVKPNTKHESLHIPVVITESGINDLVYNDFEIGANSDIVIIAGCGIHNDGHAKSQHDGIHFFHIDKGAKVKYIEKHYGEGSGDGERELNPTTIVKMEENSYCEMEMVQIEGVNSTIRETTAYLAKGAKLIVIEKLMTHDNQIAHSNMTVYLNGEDSTVQVISRSVAKNDSEQVFHPTVVGNEKCRAHVQCDSIIMDKAKVRSVPEIAANNTDAQMVHEAAIGKINNDQLIKLQTFGMDEEEAEDIIVEAFLN
ncbi:SufD family Fe-S cluster assembly protein [Romboutsia ilealis]|uniref:SufD family Fe-S cluster assembly protein n=1 Tax=Romboutsia faecis TaxID=2764597 RepID=A0ABR7JN11_9FIRM|nr:SufD family Fe-S cluster assembly protein [Romboutsia faecis]MBC5996245.1 SufD family Fe-S cluster assembly protein [Romboutsia faecis]MRN25113.1 SufD family Fe-S cluster assembly protein [Romboutsia ilealis]